MAQATSVPDAAEQHEFDVVSIHKSAPHPVNFGFEFSPRRFTGRAMTTMGLISIAYEAKQGTVSGEPAWVDSDYFDIVAQVDNAVAERWASLSAKDRLEETRPMIRSLLKDRFQLRMRLEKKEVPVYTLVIAKSGSKLTPSVAEAGEDLSRAEEMELRVDGKGWTGKRMTIAQLAGQLSGQPDVDRIVVDETGLTGRYDFTLHWSSGRDAESPSLFTALEEQLGLRLVPRRSEEEAYVVEHVERPSEN